MLRQFIDVAELEEDEVKGIRVYCLGKSGLGDDEHVWQHKATPGLLEEIIDHFDLQSVKTNGKEAQIFWQQVPLSWCDPKKVGEHEFFAREPWVGTHDGSHCILMHDKEQKVVSVWYNFVF